jgi:FkbM family methyltransferase
MMPGISCMARLFKQMLTALAHGFSRRPRRDRRGPMTADDALPNWSARLTSLYAALAEHQARGEPELAGAREREIAALLIEAVPAAYAAGCAHRAARRDRAALRDLDIALDLFRWKPPGLALPVPIAACYRALGALYQDWGQPVATAAATMLALRGGQSFYTRPPLCQIPVLEGLLEQLYGRRADGAFVEVGAFDGETYGNTAGLADLGWSGLYIEPVPESYEQCCRRHARNPRVTVLNAAVGATAGATTLWVAREYSTVKREQIAHGVRQGWMSETAFREIVVPQITLAGALAQAGVAPGFELLVADVEGAEEQVFAGFDFAHWRPQAVIVELADYAPPGEAPADPAGAGVASARRVRAQIEAAGYAAIYADHTNTVFRRRL